MPSGQGLNMTLLAILKVNGANWLLVLEKNWSCGKMFLLLTRYHYWLDNINSMTAAWIIPSYIYIFIYLSPLKFLLQNAIPQGRYRMVFDYHFVPKFDLGWSHIVRVPHPGPMFYIGLGVLLLSSPDHSVQGLKRANQWPLQIEWIVLNYSPTNWTDPKLDGWQ